MNFHTFFLAKLINFAPNTEDEITEHLQYIFLLPKVGCPRNFVITEFRKFLYFRYFRMLCEIA
jgi:hypothetical protein